MKENLFYELNITEDGYVIGRLNHDEADSVSIIGYTEESRHARLFCAAPELLEALRAITYEYSLLIIHNFDFSTLGRDEEYNRALAAINKATGETK